MSGNAAARTARWVLLCAGLGGCLPFVAPPLQIAIGTGVQGQRSEPPAFAIPVQLRVGAHPLGFVQALLMRRVDFGVGWLLDYSQLLNLVHGGYAEFSVVLLQTSLGQGVGRLGARAQGRLLNRVGNPQLGGGAALLLTWEYAYFVEGEFGSIGSRGGVSGYRYGEGSIGGFLEGSVYVLGPVSWAVTAGVLFRAPAMAGMVFGVF